MNSWAIRDQILAVFLVLTVSACSPTVLMVKGVSDANADQLLEELSGKRVEVDTEVNKVRQCLENRNAVFWVVTWGLLAYVSAGISGLVALKQGAVSTAGAWGVASGGFKAVDDSRDSKVRLASFDADIAALDKTYKEERKAIINGAGNTQPHYFLAMSALDDLRSRATRETCSAS